MTEPSAAERYKELTGWATEAIDRMRREDREKVLELERKLADSQQLMAEAAQREKLAQLGVQLRWEAVVEALWDERWLQMTPLPKPDPSAPDMDLGYFDDEIERGYQALEETLRKRSLLRRGNS